MQIYVLRHGQQAGPYTLEQVQQELEAGSLRTNDLAWYEGAPQWLPLASVPGLNAPASVPPPAPYPPYTGASPYLSYPIQTSGLAVASLVLGLLGLILAGLPSIPAVICGHLSLSQIKRSMGRLGGQGMAIAGLVMGYLSLALFAIVILGFIAGIALPVFSAVQEKGQETKSLTQAMTIGTACKAYAVDKGHFPKTLEELVPTYLEGKDVFVCPLDRTRSPMGYEYFGGADSEDPHDVLLQSKAATRTGRRVVVHVDGSTELVRR